MPHASLALPRLTVLSAEQIAYIHQQSLRILATTGVRVDSPRALDLFAARLGPATVQGNLVRIPAESVEWALAKAPSTVEIFNRRGESQFRLGEGRARFGIGVTNLYYQDPQTDEVSHFTRQHMQTGVRLGDRLPHYDVISTLGVLHDYPPEIADLYAVLEMTTNTTKPMVLLISQVTLFPTTLDMLEKLYGDLGSKPFVIPYFNPVTPLIVNADTSDKMFAAMDRGLPFIYSNYGMAGVSTPISSAGTLALLNAELLAGLVLSQLYKPGSSIILGSLPAFFDMKAMIDFYDPQTLLINLACAEMMAHYSLPHAGTSGSGTGWGPDLLEASTGWLNHLTSTISKVGLVPFAGSTLGSLAFSPNVVVNSHDIIGRALHFGRGFAVDDASVALDEIQQVGPGENFLVSPLTLKNYRSACYVSDVYPTISLDTWQKQGRPNGIARLREVTGELIASAQPPDDYAELTAKGEAFIEALGLPVDSG